MSTTQATATTPETQHARRMPRLRHHLEAIRERIDIAVRERDELLLTAQAQLIAIGIDAAVVPTSTWMTPGASVSLVNGYMSRGGRTPWLHTFSQPYEGHDPRYVGPFQFLDDEVTVYRGRYEVLVVDSDYALLAKTFDDENEPAGHARAVGRLRRLAKQEHMRVRVRDRDVTVLSPMNDVVHEGDVVTAYLWLAGIDTNTVRTDNPIEVNR